MIDYTIIERYLLLFAIFVLGGTIFFSLIRTVLGPRVTDRVVGVNLVTTKSIMVIAILAIYFKKGYLVDIAIIYSLLSFFAVVVLAQFVAQFKKNKNQVKKKENSSAKVVNDSGS